jgi:hypothetical protein
MRSPKQKPFRYKNGKTEITAEFEGKHHVRMMWFDLVMKWVYRIGISALLGLLLK